MSTTGTDERVGADRHLLEDLVRAALRRSAEDGWDVRHRPPWTFVPGADRPVPPLYADLVGRWHGDGTR
ncbi:hypothetical protein ACFYUV_49005 [Nonomuraea sp. NPDC003560]|uniref:hypothetical protein n=1 Tax=Nonomuraea sp. NPDC003560 TaxID=3364341 RepID=UPI0036C6D143